MLDITLVAVGKIKEKALAELADVYLKRLQPYAKLRLIELPAVPFSGANQTAAKEKEGAKIQKCLNRQNSQNIYLLAERGKTFSSPQLAQWLEKQAPLILVVGGALGFSEELYKKYPQISLAELTFPHEMARLILLEQIYRATTILNKKAYHY